MKLKRIRFLLAGLAVALAGLALAGLAGAAPAEVVVGNGTPGSCTESNLNAALPLGSRFVFSNYLTGLSPATRTQTDPRADASANVVAESWAMFEADLASRRPRLFVDTSPGDIAAYGKFPPGRYPRLQAILDRDYTTIGRVAGARILALRAP